MRDVRWFGRSAEILCISLSGVVTWHTRLSCAGVSYLGFHRIFGCLKGCEVILIRSSDEDIRCGLLVDQRYELGLDS